MTNTGSNSLPHIQWYFIFLLATALSRSHYTKRSTQDLLNEEISEDWSMLFVTGTHMIHWMWVSWPWYPMSMDNSKYMLKKSSVCFSWSPVASGIQLQSPRKQKGSSKTSWHFILSAKWGSLPFPVDIWLATLVDRPVTSAPHRSECWTPLSQESDTFLITDLSGETARICVTQGLLETPCEDAEALSGCIWKI